MEPPLVELTTASTKENTRADSSKIRILIYYVQPVVSYFEVQNMILTCSNKIVNLVGLLLHDASPPERENRAAVKHSLRNFSYVWSIVMCHGDTVEVNDSGAVVRVSLGITLARVRNRECREGGMMLPMRETEVPERLRACFWSSFCGSGACADEIPVDAPAATDPKTVLPFSNSPYLLVCKLVGHGH
jgi:hypothetical protein